jgi:anti-sigma factor RsiW
MNENPACPRFLPLLSAYIDTELAPHERTQVERHLSACPSCTLRAADLRAESALVRVGLDIVADEIDFKDFPQKVLARLTPEQPPFWERLSLWSSELLAHERRTVVALAVGVLAVLGPWLWSERTPEGYAQKRLEVQAVSVDKTQLPEVQPVVVKTESGDAIIFLTEPSAASPNQAEREEEGGLAPAAPQDTPTGGEL